MQEHQTRADQKPTVAFVLSLLAGLWMLATGAMMYGFNWGPGAMGGWMWGHGMMGFGYWWPWFGLIAGVVVLIGAVMLYSKPEQSPTWGIVILIASALNFLVGMGGFLAGVLGVIGGTLALSTRSEKPPASS
jgi:hypothetical protein